MPKNSTPKAAKRAPTRKPKGAYRHGDLRNAVLAEALALIQERKQVDFNLRELSSRVGVSHTAVYRHFGSKRDILAAIALAGYQRLLFLFQQAGTESRAGKAGTDPDPVMEQGKAYVRFAVQNPGHFRAMGHPELQPFLDFPELYATAKAVLQTLIAQIKAQIDAGNYRKASAIKTAYVAWASVHGLAHLIVDQLLIDSMDPAPIDVEKQLGFLAQTLRQGFVPDRG